MKEGIPIQVVGGGQLGMLFADEAIPAGHPVTVLDSTPGCPASYVGADQVVGGLKDPDAILELGRSPGVLTWEIEHIAIEPLLQLIDEGYDVQPSPQTLRTIQNKLEQKRYLASKGIMVAPFEEVRDPQDLAEIFDAFGGIVLKSQQGGYDARGNFVVRDVSQLQAAWDFFQGQPVYAEQLLRFQKELSVIGARSMTGDIALYTAFEMIHVNGICDTVYGPAPVSERVHAQATELGQSVLQVMQGAGIFATEMFMLDDGTVMVNEIAPRPHNTGHLTIEAAETSQNMQLLRAITGQGLGPPDLISPAVMINGIGKVRRPAVPYGMEAARAMGAHPHWYHKHEERDGRKIFHVTATGETLDDAYKLARQARNAMERPIY